MAEREHRNESHATALGNVLERQIEGEGGLQAGD